MVIKHIPGLPHSKEQLILSNCSVIMFMSMYTVSKSGMGYFVQHLVLRNLSKHKQGNAILDQIHSQYIVNVFSAFLVSV